MNGESRNGNRRIAIACQGGGSHAAFTAGVLMEFLQSGKFQDNFGLVALTGTSGGAVCVSVVWSALHRAKGSRVSAGLAADEYKAAVEAVRGFWEELAARDPMDEAVNLWGQWLTHLPVTLEVSPYVFDCGAASKLRDLLKNHVRLEAILSPNSRCGDPVLFVGVTDAKNGQGWAVRGEGIEYDDIIASAAVPPLFKAVDTRNTFCWDGLFSRNPPIRELTNLAPPPEEIWVIQINPQVCRQEPMTMVKIIDRRNQLSGNLALAQEMKYIDTINQLIDDLRTSNPRGEAALSPHRPASHRTRLAPGLSLEIRPQCRPHRAPDSSRPGKGPCLLGGREEGAMDSRESGCLPGHRGFAFSGLSDHQVPVVAGYAEIARRRRKHRSAAALTVAISSKARVEGSGVMVTWPTKPCWTPPTRPMPTNAPLSLMSLATVSCVKGEPVGRKLLRLKSDRSVISNRNALSPDKPTMSPPLFRPRHSANRS